MIFSIRLFFYCRMFRLVINMHAKLLLTTLLLISSFTVTVYSQELTLHITAHDPSIIKVDDTYYLYCTGKGIATWSSKDLLNWKSDPPVFSSPPKWTLDAVPGFKNSIWGARYFLFKRAILPLLCCFLFWKK